eukprot:scaffold194308_cov30-Tisochrysis_lutea.AAC.3
MERAWTRRSADALRTTPAARFDVQKPSVIHAALRSAPTEHEYGRALLACITSASDPAKPACAMSRPAGGPLGRWLSYGDLAPMAGPVELELVYLIEPTQFQRGSSSLPIRPLGLCLGGSLGAQLVCKANLFLGYARDLCR